MQKIANNTSECINQVELKKLLAEKTRKFQKLKRYLTRHKFDCKHLMCKNMLSQKTFACVAECGDDVEELFYYFALCFIEVSYEIISVSLHHREPSLEK